MPHPWQFIIKSSSPTPAVSFGDQFADVFFDRRISVDTKLHHLLSLNIKQSFWERGNFPATVHNGSDVVLLDDPWVNGTKAAPFDQREFWS